MVVCSGYSNTLDLLKLPNNKEMRKPASKPFIVQRQFRYVANANFPLGLAPQKRPPQVIKTWVKCWENSVFLRLVGAFFGEPTQVENCQSPTLTFDMEAKNGQGQKVKILQTKVQIRCEQK